MPTGYTAPVQSGEITDFKDFALLCARGMGALVMMRDEPLDATIPTEFQPSDYYRKQLKKARARLNDVQGWSESKAEQEAAQAYKEALGYYEERLRETSEQIARYRAMLAMVEAWSPPTADHVGLKRFMVEQLTESIRFDSYTLSLPERFTGEQFKANEIERAQRDIAHHEQSYADDVRRTNERNAWLRELRESL